MAFSKASARQRTKILSRFASVFLSFNSAVINKKYRHTLDYILQNLHSVNKYAREKSSLSSVVILIMVAFITNEGHQYRVSISDLFPHYLGHDVPYLTPFLDPSVTQLPSS